ncbi:MAG: 1-acyl-sn-glycerol-3-phosphate acyltransferase [Bacteroidales bacterium]|nr:1-acyl-sn-glycerol-3-phosphate acyltransferase [Candidatus Sodaliphilus aphodohippi]
MKYLYRLYQWCIATPIILVLTILTAIVVTLFAWIDKDWWGYYPPRLWSRLWCWLMLVKVKVEHRDLIDSKASYVFVANHQGAFDIFSIYGFLGHNFKWMMRKGLSNIPLIGIACNAAGHIMVDTHSNEGIKATISNAKKRLQKGMSIVVFPEGRRTDTGEMGQFKNGAFRLATEFDLPIVPITINGSYNVMPRSTFNVTPGTITLTIHAPILPDSEDHNAAHIAEQCRTIIAKDLR